jgi:hypothetical protein
MSIDPLHAAVRLRLLWQSVPKALIIVVSFALHAGLAAAQASPTWPRLHLPDNLSIFPIGEKMTVGGLPMRMVGFVSPQPPATLLAQLRHSLGQPLVESTRGDRLILARAEGRFYLTVQVSASVDGSRGIVAITDLGAPRDAGAAQASAARWLDRLPSGSSISSDISTDDAGKSARHLIVVNGHAESVNRDAMLRLMQEDGYRLERETRADAARGRDLPARFADATALYFTAPSKQAVAVIVRENGRTAVIVNTVTEIQAFR